MERYTVFPKIAHVVSAEHPVHKYSNPRGRERERERNIITVAIHRFHFYLSFLFPYFSLIFSSLSLSLSLSLFSFIIFLLFAAIPSETKSNYESNYETLNTLEEFFSPKGAPLDKKRISPPCN